MLKVIVVDDNYLIRKGLSKKINQLPGGYRVICDAADAVEAKRLILERRPQIVVTDIRMPGNSGLEMIKGIYEVYRPQVIVISGFTEFEYAREAVSLGVIAYLVKPIDESELNEALYRAADCITQNPYGPPRHGREAGLKEDADNPEGSSAGASEEAGGSALKSHYAKEAMRYIREHYAEKIIIAEIADRLGLSESYLSRTFREETGFTITDYRACCCIAVAELFLEDPGVKIYEVADKTGFADQRYFSRLFRQRTGLTPMEYRRRSLAGHRIPLKNKDDHLIDGIKKSFAHRAR